MERILLSSILFLSMPVMAYTPKLLLVDQGYGFKQFIDENTIKKIDKSLMSVMVYEKYTYKNSDEYAKNYQSSIKKYIVDCPYKSLAMGSANYYSGLTSNSGFVGSYNNILGHNGDTGEAFYFYDDLTYTSIKNSASDQKIYKRVCIGKWSSNTPEN